MVLSRASLFAWSATKRGRNKMAQTTFEVDETTLAAIAELKEKLGVKTNAAVLRKALALAREAAQNADSNNTVTIMTPQNEMIKILMRG